MSVYEALFKRQLDKLEPYIQEQWSFDYHSGHEFIIRSDNENMVDNIYIYEKEKEDGVIDVTFYSTDFNLNGNIIDDDRFTPSIELIENELVIIRSAEIEFTIAGEEQELIISQFSEHPRNLMSGDSVLRIIIKMQSLLKYL
ncbi:hypothetical protein [Bacillus sp. JCM 19034]|uniref:hypothetical protein n=1 Tax=Bacillus sp. JCM 19034 TaxID=1481928 RepID=UPI0007847055|nr:hypothetical protein [Bacillus sp. JCM 19034]